MYVSNNHRFSDFEAVIAVMESHPLEARVVYAKEGLVANHIPFVLDRSRGPNGTLMGHVSRADTVWQLHIPNTPTIVMFQGAQSYITPSWYPGKTEHERVVPTWNYVVAQAHRTAQVVEDKNWMLKMFNLLTNTQESAQPCPWRVGDAPSDYVEELMGGVVGIEIPIDRLEGKSR